MWSLPFIPAVHQKHKSKFKVLQNDITKEKLSVKEKPLAGKESCNIADGY